MSTQLHDYAVLEKLGQGSFGAVHKVQHRGTCYVMKMIDVSGMTGVEQAAAQREVSLMQQLHNPYIVQYVDSFTENKTLYIVMEFCERGDLHQFLRERGGQALPEPQVWHYFIQICLGLEYLHANKILHRDMKSMNIFLARQDTVRIGDLGVAKVIHHTESFAHTMVGTPYYLSPELCEDKPYNAKSDMWALGCILYEMCTLRHPFDARNQGALILKILRGMYQPVSPQYSLALRNLIKVLLSKDSEKRPSITQVLSHPCVREKVAGLVVPDTSILTSRIEESKKESRKDIKKETQKEIKKETVRKPARVSKGLPLSRQAQRSIQKPGYARKSEEVAEVEQLPDEPLSKKAELQRDIERLQSMLDQAEDIQIYSVLEKPIIAIESEAINDQLADTADLDQADTPDVTSESSLYSDDWELTMTLQERPPEESLAGRDLLEFKLTQIQKREQLLAKNYQAGVHE